MDHPFLNGKRMTVTKDNLNESMLERNKCTDKDVEDILEWSNELERVFAHMQTLDPKKDDLYGFALIVERIEFELQKAWNFPEDRNCHTWWYRTPHCECPYMDNEDLFGTEYRNHRIGCPVHKTDVALPNEL